MAERIEPDICVIGGGSAGLSVAAAAAVFGVSVVLVEKGKTGGSSLNNGCMPSKALIAAARRASAIRHSAPFGVTARAPAVEFGKVHAHLQRVAAAIAPNDSVARFTGLGVRMIAGTASFKDARTLLVGDAYEIKARRFVIATGSSPAAPPVPGLSETKYLTNETIFDLTECPRHLLVLGAGPTGIELAQAFRRLGADVTVFDAGLPLPKDDPECAAVVLDQLAREGVTLRAGVEVLRVEPAGAGARVIIKGIVGEESVDCTHLLVVDGRRPNLEELGLAAAGIKHEPTGIVVDRGLMTSNRRVFAIGDVIGAVPFTHVATYHADIVIRRALFRSAAKVDDDAITWVTFTDPELAQVGLQEAEAKRRFKKINVLRAAYNDNDRAQAEGTTAGHIKVITAQNGQVLGATIVGAQAGELITAWSLAVNQRLKIGAFAEMIVPYPTLAEVGKRAAMEYFRPSLTRPWLRRIIGILRRFG
jgi:pyruvate/2-oxoglutarate dehydrogenase complex dihydrolipoamide dehydrogenase (E3) component